MPASEWDEVRQALEDITAASRAGDADGLFRALNELDIHSPVLVRRIGEEPSGPPDEPIRERLNQLVHTFESAGDPEPADEE